MVLFIKLQQKKVIPKNPPNNPSITISKVPYILFGIPEMIYPEAIMPSLQEVASVFIGNMWGNIYPREGTWSSQMTLNKQQ